MEYFRQRFIDELNEEGDIEIRGVTFSREAVLKSMDRNSYDEVFREWNEQVKVDAKRPVQDFLNENGCLVEPFLLSHSPSAGVFDLRSST